MTPQELKSLIDADATAKSLADAGNDSGCAERCSAIAPAEPVPTFIGELGIMRVFAAADQPFGGDDFLSALESLSNAGEPFSGSVKRILRSIYPPAAGVDFGDLAIRSQLDQFVAGNLLNAESVGIVKAAAEQRPKITADEVSAAMKPSRENA